MTYPRSLRRFTLLATCLGALLAGPALADSPCSEMGPGNYHHDRQMKFMEQHRKQLHDALKLTPEQDAAWTKMMDTEHAKDPASMGKPEDWSALSIPDRADKMLAMAKTRLDRMTEHVAALKAFYSTLTPEQQKTFDSLHKVHQGGMSRPGMPMGGASTTGKTPPKP